MMNPTNRIMIGKVSGTHMPSKKEALIANIKSVMTYKNVWNNAWKDLLSEWSCEDLVLVLQDDTALETALTKLRIDQQAIEELEGTEEPQNNQNVADEPATAPTPQGTFSTPESSPSREFDILAPPDANAAAKLLELVKKLESQTELAEQITERLLEERDYSVRELLSDSKKLAIQVDRAKLRFIRETLDEDVIRDQYLDKLGFLLSEFYSPETCKLLISHMNDLSIDDLEEMTQRRPVLQHKAKLLYQSLQ